MASISPIRVPETWRRSETLLDSKWRQGFFENLSKLNLIRDIESISISRRLNFEIVSPSGKAYGEKRYFFLSVNESKFSDIDQLLIYLSPHVSCSGYQSHATLRNNVLVLKHLEEDFFGRFALEIFDWVTIAKEKDSGSIVCEIPLLVDLIYSFAVKSQRGGINLNSRRFHEYSHDELEEVLQKLGLNYLKIESLLEESRPERNLLEAKKLFKNIRESFYGKQKLKSIFMLQRSKIANLVDLMIEAGLKPEDMGESQASLEKIIAHYQLEKIPYHIFDVD